MKHGLSRDETLPLAILCFVNHTITNKYPRNHLSINDLPKTSKIGVFLTECLFRDQYPLFFGVKIRIIYYKFSLFVLSIFRLRKHRAGHLLCTIAYSIAQRNHKIWAVQLKWRDTRGISYGQLAKKMPLGIRQW